MQYIQSSEKDILKRRDIVARYIRLALCRRSIDISVRDILDSVSCTGEVTMLQLKVLNSQIRLLVPNDVATVLPAIQKRIDLFCQISTYQRLHQKQYLKDIPDLVLRFEALQVTTHEQMQLYRGLIERNSVPSPQLQKMIKMNPDNPRKAIYTNLS